MLTASPEKPTQDTLELSFPESTPVVTVCVILVQKQGWLVAGLCKAGLLGHCEAQDHTEFWASPNMWASWFNFLSWTVYLWLGWTRGS